MARSPTEGAATALGSAKISSAGDAVACTLFEITAHRPMGGVSLDWAAMLSVARATEDTEEELSFSRSKSSLAADSVFCILFAISAHRCKLSVVLEFKEGLFIIISFLIYYTAHQPQFLILRLTKCIHIAIGLPFPRY